MRSDGVSVDPRQPCGWCSATHQLMPGSSLALELGGDLGAVLDDLGRRDVMQLLVEGGAHVAGDFHRKGLVNRYVFYLAPVFLGGDDGRPVFVGTGVPTMSQAWRGRLVSFRRLGDDLRIDIEPAPPLVADRSPTASPEAPG